MAPKQDSSATSSDGSHSYLFSMDRLTSLSKWKDIEVKLSNRGLIARPLQLDDYENGYLELLRGLTEVGNVTKSEYEQRFTLMKQFNQVGDHYVIVVIEDIETKKVVGASTLRLELKFIHQCATKGMLEDVAVLNSYRGKQIGEIVVKIIVELAHESYKCYKLSLDCKDELIKFYKKNGFNYNCNTLTIRFD